MTEFKVKDVGAAIALAEAMIGWTHVGVDGAGNEISRPTSPSVRAHIEAAIGNKTPDYGRDAKEGRLAALAEYLRSVADTLATVTR